MNVDEEKLLVLARQFREAAAGADRPDVVAKIDDTILLLAGATPKADESKSNVVLRILDGLGL